MMTQDKTREKIISFATKHFFTYGYSKISTEELASGLAMSKSTLYKYFPRKDELLDTVIETFYASQVAVIEEIVQNHQSTIQQKIKRFLDVVGSRIAILKAEALEDLKRTMPEAYEKLMKLRKKVILDKLTHLFQEGVKQGCFRNDIDAGFVVSVFLVSIETLTKPDYLIHSPYSYEKVVQHVFTLVIDGYVSRTNSGG